MVDILYLSLNPTSPAKPYWDQALLDDILHDPIFTKIPGKSGAVVVIPGAYQGDYIDGINKALAKYNWVVLFITSDEESKFPIEKINHPRIQIYIQYPKQGRHDKYKKWPLGYTMETRDKLQQKNKDVDVFFSGQVTHQRRSDCIMALRSKPLKDYKLAIYGSEGFAQGLNSELYMEGMQRGKVAPSPAGPVSADAFRTYEALEAGAVPIADNVSAAGDHDYVKYLLGDVPFPTIDDYKDLPGYIEDTLKEYPAINNRAQAWWIKKKRDLKQSILDDIGVLSGFDYNYAITVVIPVSPIKSHPSTQVLDETVKSIRHHLKEAEIIITFDGVRPEQESKRGEYETFIQSALFRCNTDWNATPIIFDEHTHQVGMMNAALDIIKTPTVLYVEQDTPLVTDYDIPFAGLFQEIFERKANVIRFHFEAKIPEPHKHLMLGAPENELLKTIQWSQRPHLASTEFYRYILKRNFSPDAKCFIEDKIHGVVQDDWQTMGLRGWEMWKLWIYHPQGGNIKRSLHLDGREGEPKYDGNQKY